MMRRRFDRIVVRIVDVIVFWVCREMMRSLMRNGRAEPSAFMYLLHKRVQMGPKVKLYESA